MRSAAGGGEAETILRASEYKIGLDPDRVDADLWQFSDAMRSLELRDGASLTREDAEVLRAACERRPR